MNHTSNSDPHDSVQRACPSRQWYTPLLRLTVGTVPLFVGPLLLHPTTAPVAIVGYFIRFLTLLFMVVLWRTVRYLMSRYFFQRTHSTIKQVVCIVSCTALVLAALAIFKHTFASLAHALYLILAYMGASASAQVWSRNRFPIHAIAGRFIAAYILGYLSLYVLWGAHDPLFLVFALFAALLEGASSLAEVAILKTADIDEKTRNVLERGMNICLVFAAILPGMLGVFGFIHKQFLMTTLYVPLVSKLQDRRKAFPEDSNQNYSEVLALGMLLFVSVLLIALLLDITGT